MKSPVRCRRSGISPIAGPHRLCDDSHDVRTVLIVDDHAGFRGFARRLLEAGGFTVVGEASDGASALAASKSCAPSSCSWTSSCRTRTASRSPSSSPTTLERPVVILTSSREAVEFAAAARAQPRARLHPQGRSLGTALAALAGEIAMSRRLLVGSRSRARSSPAPPRRAGALSAQGYDDHRRDRAARRRWRSTRSGSSTGLIAWQRRPENRVGALMTAARVRRTRCRT